MIVSEETTQETTPNFPEETNTETSTPPPAPFLFDWGTISKTGTEYSPDERARFEELYTQSLSTISENEIIEGTVVAITEKDVVVNIGFKSDGLVALAEFREHTDLKVGDKIDVYVESQEDVN